MLICCHVASQFLVGMFKISESNFLSLHLPQEDNWVRLTFCSGDSELERSQCDMSLISTVEVQTAAWYWAIQTVTTVGYGDISHANSQDRLFRMVCMMVGVQVFSNFLSSISYEPENEKVLDHESMDVKDKIDQIKQKQKLNGRNSLQFDLLITVTKNMDMRSEQDLIEQLPDEKKIEIYDSIQDNLCNKIEMFNILNVDIFINLFKNMKLIGKASTDLI